MSAPTDPLPPEVRDALESGNQIEAIKRLRNATGLGLAEAKAMIEFHRQPQANSSDQAGSPLSAPGVLQALNAGNKIEAIKRLREHAGIDLKDAKDKIEAALGSNPAAFSSNLAPGEVPRSTFSGWWLVILALAALLLYFEFFNSQP